MFRCPRWMDWKRPSESAWTSEEPETGNCGDDGERAAAGCTGVSSSGDGRRAHQAGVGRRTAVAARGLRWTKEAHDECVSLAETSFFILAPRAKAEPGVALSD